MGDLEDKTHNKPSIPAELLWDVSPGDVSWEDNRDFIMGRVLMHGTEEHIQTFREEVGDEVIREYLVSTRGRALDRKRLRLLETVLELPHDEVSEWLDDAIRQILDRR